MGLLVETHAGLIRAVSPSISANGLLVPEFEVLVRLSRTPRGRLRMSDLAAQVGLSSSGLTRLVDRLERERLVAREPCPSDRRGAYTVITASGRRRIGSAVAQHLEVLDHWFTGLLDAEELATLMRLLRKVRDHVNPGATTGAQAAKALTPVS
ncbi:MAG: winged helix-turn-helix transcriptional regulator [Actinobacteria bacterium]|nr:winged helix-turn-helix transcriptional regulator [Actinomycetota bacterium]